MSNEAKMSLEEKIVQRLKDDTLMMAVGDEDMLTDLVKRAVTEALFQQKVIPSAGYGQRGSVEDSLVVSVAKPVAEKAAKEVADGLLAKIMADENLKKAIYDAIPGMLIDQLRTGVNVMIDNVVRDASQSAQFAIRDAIQSGEI